VERTVCESIGILKGEENIICQELGEYWKSHRKSRSKSKGILNHRMKFIMKIQVEFTLDKNYVYIDLSPPLQTRFMDI
jgi:hypothetical protein